MLPSRILHDLGNAILVSDKDSIHETVDLILSGTEYEYLSHDIDSDDNVLLKIRSSIGELHFKVTPQK